ncbi:MAG: ABC transporter ATP-binding protein, partial [Actinomycetota bacterium]|nr:ABC transporter ATP-binding protein [Actinomycetota bacterium]
MTDRALALDRVAKAWGSAVALDGVSLDVGPGELLAVVGPSGSGKSTLLRVIAGLEAPDAGRVSVGGRDVTGEPPERRGVAMVFQSFALFPHMDVESNVGFGLLARGVAAGERRRRVAEVAERLG